jgi:hypothetical protein
MRQAGPGFSDPAFQLSIEWLATPIAIERAENAGKSEIEFAH